MITVSGAVVIKRDLEQNDFILFKIPFFVFADSGELRIRLKTYSNIKLWVNGTKVVHSHEHTFSQDSASLILPPTRLQTLECSVFLRKGSNRILIKNDVDYGDMMFEFVIDRIGQ